MIFKNVKKDSSFVLSEIGEMANAHFKMVELIEKWFNSKEFMGDEEFVRDVLITAIENLEREEENQRKGKKCRLELELLLEIAVILVARC
ncbi:hypothetical protein NPIL_502501 [Nephila pilipes]|uniref:Uncharacterized protein n=1 Tax=Nephila pilipes TaxID=299642 RepID=A0A8X6TYS1_NEPPI|nr:hypothetical protein NPIL_502501 [Nephila pilipes]